MSKRKFMGLEVVLLAAGFGKRLLPTTASTPKCLISILGKPLLRYWLELLFQDERVTRVFINTHYLSDQVEDFINQSTWKDKIEMIYEPVLRGTAGTLGELRGLLKSDTVMVAHADNLSRFDLGEFLHAHHSRPPNCLGTMMTFETDSPGSCGILQLDEAGTVLEMYEKTTGNHGNLANAAVYLFEKEVFESLGFPDVKEPDISNHLVPRFLGRLHTWHNTVYHRDIGTPEALAIAEKEYASLITCDVQVPL